MSRSFRAAPGRSEPLVRGSPPVIPDIARMIRKAEGWVAAAALTSAIAVYGCGEAATASGIRQA